MFLDDALYNYTIQNKEMAESSFENVVNFCRGLWNIVDKKIADQVMQTVTYGDYKIIVDAAFNSWNLFVNRLKKENIFTILDDLLSTTMSYRTVFMNNEKLVEIYNKGK